MKCVIIAGSPEYNIDFIKSQINYDDFVVCADKGYEYCKKANITPDLIVGDFDSYDGALPENVEILKLNPRKDDTDVLSCIKKCIQKGYKEFLILCALGGRLDHTFANLSLLLFLFKNNCTGVIKTEKESVYLISNASLDAENVKSKTFSVFPFGCENVYVTYEGKVAYPIENYLMKSEFPIGVSNVFLEDKAKISARNGNIILIINENT